MCPGKMEFHNKHILTCRGSYRSLLAWKILCKHNAQNHGSHLVTKKVETVDAEHGRIKRQNEVGS